MMFLSSILTAFAQIVHIAIWLYIIILVAAALISWVEPNPYNPIVRILHKLTHPVYFFIKKFIPTTIGGIDLAPIIVIFALQFLDIFLVTLLTKIINAI